MVRMLLIQAIKWPLCYGQKQFLIECNEYATRVHTSLHVRTSTWTTNRLRLSCATRATRAHDKILDPIHCRNDSTKCMAPCAKSSCNLTEQFNSIVEQRHHATQFKDRSPSQMQASNKARTEAKGFITAITGNLSMR